MKANKYIPTIFVIALLLLILKSFFNQYVPNYEFLDWEHGASGYHLALEEAKAAEKPLILYFHTSWCGWCKKLDQNYLATSEAEEFLRNIPKVEINPDKGKAEKALFSKFGLTGYPSFLLLIPKISSEAVKISPFLNARELSVEEFLDKIRKGIALGYNSGGRKP
jgi:thiol-disulfide isomerase/thioredoxin